MVPNILFSLFYKKGFSNRYKNKAALFAEQTGRYACMFFMVFNLPCTWFGFYFPYAEIVYGAAGAILTITYCMVWILFRKKNPMTKVLLLSILPSVIFLFSGIVLASIPLIVSAVVFSAAHILVSVKNAKSETRSEP